MYLIAGLGNPGGKYENTRHNVGFQTIDLLSDAYGIAVDRSKFKSLMGKGRIEGEEAVLLKPLTYMNLSGEAVKEAMNFYKLPPENVIVICDDIDIPFGTIRIKQKGSAGTHNGLKSIVKEIKTDQFPRVKIAVGQKPGYMDLAAFVLSTFSKEEERIVRMEIKDAKDAIGTILRKNIQDGMSLFNGIKHEIDPPR
ncbi:MAG: aminoacyl-tRNA hydrolase [Gallicola sp.]|nr:aminoacyl-tRNA hydrolase [Gallicola sp.]